MLSKQFKNSLVNINSYLILLFPFALVSGPLIPEIFLFVIVFSFVYLVQSEKKFKYFNNNFFKIFLFFFLIININSFYNFYSISIKNSIFYFRFGLFSLAIYFFISENSKLKHQMFISFSVLILILFIDSTIQFFFDQNLFGFKKHMSGRVSSFFGDELVLGSFVSKFFLFYLALFYITEFSKNKISIYLIVIVFFFIIFYSAERTALASFILSILFFLMLSKSYKLILKLFLVFSFSIFILNQFNYSNFKRIFEHTKYQMFSEYNSFNFLSQRHMLHLKTAYNIFDNNMIIGAGPKSFRILCDHEKYIPKNYINKTNTIIAEKDGQIYLNVKLFKYMSEKEEVFLDLETDQILDIYNNNSNEFLNLSNYEDFFNTKFSNIKIEGKLLYKDGSYKNINFYSKLFKFNLKNKNFTQNQKILKFKPLYDNGCNTHPHNFLIQILSEIGILGFLFYIFAGMYLFFGFLNYQFNLKIFNNLYNFKTDIKICLIFASYLVVFFPIFPSGNFFNNWISMILYFPVGFLLNFIENNKTIKN